MTGWLKKADHIDLLLVVLWAASLGIRLAEAHWGEAFLCFCLLFFAVERTDLRARPRLRPNEAIVSAPIEPCADVRQFARAVTEIRTALIAEGNSPEQAHRILADMFAAQSRGDQ